MIFRLILIVSFSLASQLTYSQSFDTSLQRLAEKLAAQFQNSNIKKIAVLGFFKENWDYDNLSQLITQDFDVYINQQNLGYEVYGRDEELIQQIIKENKLSSVRELSEAATQLGKFDGIQGMIIGTYSIVGEVIRVRAKLVDIETSRQVAAVIGNIEMDDNIKEFLGIGFGTNKNGSNRGYSEPLSSNETYNFPKNVSEECMNLHSGDICFTNNLGYPLYIRFIENFSPLNTGSWSKTIPLSNGSSKKVRYRKLDMTLQPQESQCFYNSGSGAGQYLIWKSNSSEGYNEQYPLRRGQIAIEECKSKTFTIK